MNVLNPIRRLKQSTLVTGAGTYLFANLVNAVIPFLLLPVLTRYLEPSEYGEVAVFHVWVALVGALCGLSVHGAASRKYYDYDEPDKYMGEFITSCLLLLVASTTLVLVVVAPLSQWLSEMLGLSRTWLFIGIPFAFCNFLMQIRLGQWQVRKQPKNYGAFQVMRGVTDMTLSLLLVVSLVLGVTGRLSGFTLAAVIFGILAVLLLYRDNLIVKAWRPDLMREALQFGVPLIPHIVGVFLLLTVDRAIISARLGTDAAGYYMVAVQLAMVVNLVLQSVNRAYVPWLFERLKRDIPMEKRFIVKLTYCYNVSLLGCAAIGFIWAGDVLVWVAGETYSPAGEIVAWLILAQAVRGMYFMVTNYIFYAKRTGLVARITIVTGLLNVVLLFVFMDWFGLKGAAWAMCISITCQWIATWWTAHKIVPMPWLRQI